MKDRNRIKLVFVILIFLLVTSWNISNWIIDSKYEESSQLSDKFETLSNTYPNDKNIQNLKKDIKFLNFVCFDNGE